MQTFQQIIFSPLLCILFLEHFVEYLEEAQEDT